jgi:hypothetical protein
VASDRNDIRDRELRFRAVHRLSRLVPASDGEAWLAQLTRDGAQALQAGHKGLVAELMICRGILLRDWGVPAEAEFSLRAAAALCAEISPSPNRAMASCLTPRYGRTPQQPPAAPAPADSTTRHRSWPLLITPLTAAVLPERLPRVRRQDRAASALRSGDRGGSAGCLWRARAVSVGCRNAGAVSSMGRAADF